MVDGQGYEWNTGSKASVSIGMPNYILPYEPPQETSALATPASRLWAVTR